MKLLKLRKKLSHIGLLLVEHGTGFKVTGAGVDLDFADPGSLPWEPERLRRNLALESDLVPW